MIAALIVLPSLGERGRAINICLPVTSAMSHHFFGPKTRPSGSISSFLLLVLFSDTSELFLYRAYYSMHCLEFLKRAEVTGARPPPPGIIPNFVNPPSRKHIVITANIVLTIISTLFTGVKAYTAHFIIRHTRIDDCRLPCCFSLGLS